MQQSSGRDSATVVVVGVLDDERAGSSEVGNELRVFVPAATTPGTMMLGTRLDVRTAAAAAPMINTLRRIARTEFPHIPVRSAETLAAREAARRKDILNASAAAAAGGLLALFLSAIGLYAVIAFAVGQRSREIGIRAALGAKTTEIAQLFFRSGLRLSVIGLAIGLPLSLIALRLLATQMRIRYVSEPLLAATIALFVLSVAAIATWIPARRAAAVDPLTTIRSE